MIAGRQVLNGPPTSNLTVHHLSLHSYQDVSILVQLFQASNNHLQVPLLILDCKKSEEFLRRMHAQVPGQTLIFVQEVLLGSFVQPCWRGSHCYTHPVCGRSVYNRTPDHPPPTVVTHLRQHPYQSVDP
eukprot:627845-Hanusia_phi.AAC.2